MIVLFAVLVYAISMTVANFSVATFGPAVSPINSLVLIGLDLALRDWLQVRLKLWQMGVLIGVSGWLTYLLNPSAGHIAAASAAAFTAAALVDWAAFTKLRGSRRFRSNGSNIAGAVVDSIVFPYMAFGGFLPHIIALQFAAKVLGGWLWSTVIFRGEKK